MEDHVEHIVCSSEANQIILHVVTNDLVADKTPLQYLSCYLTVMVSLTEQKLSMPI